MDTHLILLSHLIAHLEPFIGESASWQLRQTFALSAATSRHPILGIGLDRLLLADVHGTQPNQFNGSLRFGSWEIPLTLSQDEDGSWELHHPSDHTLMSLNAIITPLALGLRLRPQRVTTPAFWDADVESYSCNSKEAQITFFQTDGRVDYLRLSFLLEQRIVESIWTPRHLMMRELLLQERYDLNIEESPWIFSDKALIQSLAFALAASNIPALKAKLSPFIIQALSFIESTNRQHYKAIA